jgi:GT2 family glycosyltransferase/glycosyltransferase involved in cell wall biosynthesis
MTSNSDQKTNQLRRSILENPADIAGWLELEGQLDGSDQYLPAPSSDAIHRLQESVTGPIPPRSSSPLPEASRIERKEIAPLSLKQSSLDIFILPGIEYYFRKQRPQHLANALASLGYRVWYVDPSFQVGAEEAFWSYSDNDTLIVRLPSPRFEAISIHAATLSPGEEQLITEALRRLISNASIDSYIFVVQHPFWEFMLVNLGARFIYDCIDLHEGFGNINPKLIAREKSMLAKAWAVASTSAYLDSHIYRLTGRRSTIIRNGCDVEHFRAKEEVNQMRSSSESLSIGYFGAISHWFDKDLVTGAARLLTDQAVFHFIGSDDCGLQADFEGKGLKNSKFYGEIPYETVPSIANTFDLCIIPFQLIELIKATNPVKFYEYMALGKPVVASRIPELECYSQQYRHLALVEGPEDFAEACLRLTKENAHEAIEERLSIARSNTWLSRAKALASVIQTIDPVISVIVPVYFALAETLRLVDALLENSKVSKLEILLIDDSCSVPYHDQLMAAVKTRQRLTRHRIILKANKYNRGFAETVNTGLLSVSGEYVVIANNDTCPGRGWDLSLLHHFAAERENAKPLGIVCPLTNNIGDEARQGCFYSDNQGLDKLSLDYAGTEFSSALMPVDSIAFFFIMGRKATFEEVGALSDRYTRGYFEDDDYCKRVLSHGYRIAVAANCFVHHDLSLSFNTKDPLSKFFIMLRNEKKFQERFER